MSQGVLHRLGGAASLAIGLGVGWWGILGPIRAAQAHAAEVSYETKIFVLVPCLLVFGLFFLIGGDRWAYRDVARQRPTAIGWVLLVAVAAISAATFFGLQHTFAQLGYTRA
ncbi:hypothetical protein BH11PSE2_BH11PSE2_18790 [soil metagenome]